MPGAAFSVAVSLTLSLSLAAGEPVSQTPPDVQWLPTFAKASELALKEHSLVYLLFTAGACPWCAKLKQETLKDASVKAALRGVPVVEMARGKPEFEALARRFSLSGTPLSVFVDEDGGVLGSIPGFAPADKFIAELAEARQNKQQHQALLKARADKPDDAKAAVALMSSYFERQQVKEGSDALEAAKSLIESDKTLSDNNKNGLTAQVRFAHAFALLTVKNDVDAAIAGFVDAASVASGVDAELAARSLYTAGAVCFGKAQILLQQGAQEQAVQALVQCLGFLKQCSNAYPQTPAGKQAARDAANVEKILERMKQAAAIGIVQRTDA